MKFRLFFAVLLLVGTVSCNEDAKHLAELRGEERGTAVGIQRADYDAAHGVLWTIYRKPTFWAWWAGMGLGLGMQVLMLSLACRGKVDAWIAGVFVSEFHNSEAYRLWEQRRGIKRDDATKQMIASLEEKQALERLDKIERRIEKLSSLDDRELEQIRHLLSKERERLLDDLKEMQRRKNQAGDAENESKRKQSSGVTK